MFRYCLLSLAKFAARALLVLGTAYLIVPGMFLRHLWGDYAFLVIILVFGWLGPTTAHVLLTRWIKGPERWRVRHRTEIVVALPATEAFESCVAAMWDVPRLRKMRVLDTARVEGRTRGTFWRSFGDRIRCDVIPIDDRHARVLVSSWPASGSVDADNGSNWRNLLAIGRALGAQVSG